MKILLACLFSLSAYAGCPTSWSNGYTYCRVITIDHTKVPTSDQTNFPVLVTGTYAYLATLANGGKAQNSSGFDIIFTSDSAGTVKLNWETVLYTATTGVVEYWVQLSTVSHTTDTVFYLFYGNSGVSTDQSSATATWDSSFLAVYHFADGTTLSGADSTSNANTGTLNNSPAAAVGQIDGAADITSSSGSTKNINAGANVITANRGTNATTWSFWIYPTASGTSNNPAIAHRDDNDTSAGWLIDYNKNNGFTTFLLVRSTSDSEWDTTNNALTLNAWNHVVITYTGTISSGNVIIYVNNVVATLSFITGSGTQSSDSARSLEIGSTGPWAKAQEKLDEFRIANTVRSAAWITAEYNNQNSPSTFYTIGSENTSGGGGGGVAVPPAKPIIIQ